MCSRVYLFFERNKSQKKRHTDKIIIETTLLMLCSFRCVRFFAVEQYVNKTDKTLEFLNFKFLDFFFQVSYAFLYCFVCKNSFICLLE